MIPFSVTNINNKKTGILKLMNCIYYTYLYRYARMAFALTVTPDAGLIWAYSWLPSAELWDLTAASGLDKHERDRYKQPLQREVV